VELPARFKARFGVTLEYTGGRTGELISRLRVERRSGLYSMDAIVSGAETGATMFLEKMLDPVRPLLLPEVLDPAKWKGGSPWFFDPENKYLLRLFRYTSSIVTINTDFVKPDDFKSIHDLLHPKWKRKISADDPTVAGQGASVAATLYTFLGEEFVKKFYVDNQVAISRSSRQVEDWLVRGTYPVSVGVGENGIQRLRKEGFPVQSARRLTGLPGYIGGGGFNYVCVVNRAPHPNAARLFANWLVSKEGLELYSRLLLHPTMRNDVDESFVPPYEIPQPGVNYFVHDWDFIVNHKKAVIERMGQIMGGRKP
jgi:ABC-type Fe3+ transport system substrate-binding protein